MTRLNLEPNGKQLAENSRPEIKFPVQLLPENVKVVNNGGGTNRSPEGGGGGGGTKSQLN